MSGRVNRTDQLGAQQRHAARLDQGLPGVAQDHAQHGAKDHDANGTQ